MKQFLILFISGIYLASCSQTQSPQIPTTSSYGAAFDPAGAIPVSELISQMKNKDSMNVKFTGKITQTCANAGCWMDVETIPGETMTVFMLDHSFGVPLEGCSGLMATMDGKAYYDTLSVDFQQHLAEDAGKSQEEIDAITEPKYILAFDASGVIIEGYKKNPAPGEEKKHPEKE